MTHSGGRERTWTRISAVCGSFQSPRPPLQSQLELLPLSECITHSAEAQTPPGKLSAQSPMSFGHIFYEAV